MIRFSDALGVQEVDGCVQVVCLDCGAVICDPAQNWREHVRVYDRDPREIWRWHPGHTRAPETDWAVYREFYCPHCGVMYDVQCVPTVHIDEPLWHDIRLDRFST